MTGKIILAFAAYYGLVGFYVLVFPMQFYENTPGVAIMGPYNSHFILDIGLVFLASSGALAWGAWKSVKSTMVAGAAWPLLHGLLHIQVWGGRGFPFDFIALSDWAGVIVPGLVCASLALRAKEAAS